MSAATATFGEVSSFDARFPAIGDGRGLLRGLALGFGGLAAIGAAGVSVTVMAAWLFSAAVSGSAHMQTRIPAGPGALALGNGLAKPATVAALSAPAGSADMPLAAKVARARALAFELASDAPPARPLATANYEAPAPEQATPEAAPASTKLASLPPAAAPVSTPIEAVPLPPRRAPEQAESIPLPAPHPARHDATPTGSLAPQVAVVTPPAPEKRALPQLAHNKSMALPETDSRTAVYDISARTVFLPNGERLEAHSGLGEKMDDPRYIHVRMRGATPPNVYNLTLREKLFHGVRAIRLNPVDEGKMHGRDGILAHTYMLGPNGQSNGCVSFKDYQKFLRAFLDGEIDRMVVVSHLNGAPPAAVARGGRGDGGRYAANEPFDRASGQAW